MKQTKFSLNGQDFIQLDKLIKLLGLAESGAQAHQLIDSGLVKVDGETEIRRRRKLRDGMFVEYGLYRIQIDK